MALTRRNLLLAAPALSGLAACSSGTRAQPSTRSAYVEIAKVRSAGKQGTVLVCMPETSQTREVWTGLSDELGRELDLVAVRMEGPNASAHIAEAMARHKPAALVLMNNPTLLAYAQYQRSVQPAKPPPAVVVMTSFLDERPRNVRDVTGISYEVPLITVITNVRKLIASPIDRIGVVRREALAQFVGRQAKLAQREQIRVVEEVVGPSPNSSELKRALRRLKQRCDAIWILNDDRLLTQSLIADGWLPGLNERPWVPAIVGAQSLVSPAHSFGTFAMLPDHTALGVQAANLLFDMAGENWTLPEGTDVQLPLSTTTIMDLSQARERFVLTKDALAQVDRILE